MENKFTFYKNNNNELCWWVDTGIDGEMAVSFDKKKILYLYQDYPHKFTKEQKEIFDKENPEWIEFLGR